MEKTKLTVVQAIKLIAELECLPPGPPKTPEGKQALARQFISLVGTVEAGTMLVDKLLRGSNRFPTPVEMRRVFSRFMAPADGDRVEDVDLADVVGWKTSKE
jgi:hypothetical protein